MNKTLHIAIDGNEANVKNRVGSNVYAFEILKSLERLTYRQNIRVTILLANKKVSDLPRRRRNWDYQIIGPQKFWTQWALPIHLFWNQRQYKVLFTPGHYAPRWSPIPYVSSVMDLAFLKYPRQFKKNDYLQLKKWTAYSVKNAAKVIAISEFTKSEIISTYHKNPDDIIVAYPAVQTLPKITTTRIRIVKKRFRLPDNYLLYLGTIQPRKNLSSLIKAFESLCFFIDKESFHTKTALKQRGRRSKLSYLTDLKLVIAGKVGWLSQPILDQINNSPFKHKIIQTGYVNDKIKQVLISQASALALVGFYEGFGIPPLEAMQLKTIPIVSKSSSLQEVVGNAGILVDPNDIDSITLGLKEALSLSAKQKAIMYKNARDQLNKFSWNKSAQAVLKQLIEVSNLKVV